MFIITAMRGDIIQELVAGDTLNNLNESDVRLAIYPTRSHRRTMSPGNLNLQPRRLIWRRLI